MDLAGKKVIVIGAGRTGLAVAHYCRQIGAQPIINDRRSHQELGGIIKQFEELGAILRLGSHAPEVFADSDVVILSPGVPPDLEPLSSLRNQGIPIIGEMELASQLTEVPIVAVTGTNGKSTTVSLIHAMLEASDLRSGLGGNIGRPFLELISSGNPYDVFVIEVSSYQLETIERFRAHIAVLLNISPDHLGRHQNMAGYAAAKGRIFLNQEHDDWAIYNADDPQVESVMTSVRSRRLPWSSRSAFTPGLYHQHEQVIWFQQEHQEIYDLSQFALAGLHQIENAMAAIAAARLVGGSIHGIQKTLDNFEGLPHRFETVGSFRGITFINDSKATNLGSTICAVEGVPAGRLILLAGGEHKGASYEPLKEALLANQAKAACVYGEAAGILQDTLSGALPVFRHTTLEEAFGEAISQAEDGDVVMLSPACASFDQFTDFEHRGEIYRQLVYQFQGIEQERPA